MPTFISNKGLWSPAKEEIGLINKSDKIIEYKGKKIKPGQPFVYNGPCREALKSLNNEGVATLGTDFRHDPEFRQACRNQGFDDVEAYLKHIDYDEEADTKKFKEKTATVQAHEVPSAVAKINTMGGGKDTSGNKDMDVVGGFGDQKRVGTDGKEKS